MLPSFANSIFCSNWEEPSNLNGTLPAPTNAVLLPELAQLQSLISLSVQVDVLEPRLPREWGQPGAFPRLQK